MKTINDITAHSDSHRANLIEDFTNKFYSVYDRLSIYDSGRIKDDEQGRQIVRAFISDLIEKYKGFPPSFIQNAMTYYVRNVGDDFRKWGEPELFRACEKYRREGYKPNSEQCQTAGLISERATILTKEEREAKIKSLIKSMTQDQAFEIWSKWNSETIPYKKQIAKSTDEGKAVAGWIWINLDREAQKDVLKTAERNYKTYLALNSGLGGQYGDRTIEQLQARFRKAHHKAPKELKTFTRDTTLDLGGKYVFCEKLMTI